MPAIVRVVEGDISTFDGDAVVNAANNHLRLGTEVAGALARRGGGRIQDECVEIVRRDGPIQVGGAAITGGGNLRARYVIHAAAMGDLPVTPDSIQAATRSALEVAQEHGVRSGGHAATSQHRNQLRFAASRRTGRARHLHRVGSVEHDRIA